MTSKVFLKYLYFSTVIWLLFITFVFYFVVGVFGAPGWFSPAVGLGSVLLASFCYFLLVLYINYYKL